MPSLGMRAPAPTASSSLVGLIRLTTFWPGVLGSVILIELEVSTTNGMPCWAASGSMASVMDEIEGDLGAVRDVGPGRGNRARERLDQADLDGLFRLRPGQAGAGGEETGEGRQHCPRGEFGLSHGMPTSLELCGKHLGLNTERP